MGSLPLLKSFSASSHTLVAFAPFVSDFGIDSYQYTFLPAATYIPGTSKADVADVMAYTLSLNVSVEDTTNSCACALVLLAAALCDGSSSTIELVFSINTFLPLAIANVAVSPRLVFTHETFHVSDGSSLAGRLM